MFHFRIVTINLFWFTKKGIFTETNTILDLEKIDNLNIPVQLYY